MASFLEKIGLASRMAWGSTQPCATGLRRSVCTTFVLGDKNGYDVNNKKSL